MKYFYIAVTVQEKEKFYSYAIKTTNYDNLLSKLKIKNIINAAICSTKKECENTVKAWNNTYKSNNCYLFDETF